MVSNPALAHPKADKITSGPRSWVELEQVGIDYEFLVSFTLPFAGKIIGQLARNIVSGSADLICPLLVILEACVLRPEFVRADLRNRNRAIGAKWDSVLAVLQFRIGVSL
jgi:hypothetical protein